MKERHPQFIAVVRKGIALAIVLMIVACTEVVAQSVASVENVRVRPEAQGAVLVSTKNFVFEITGNFPVSGLSAPAIPRALYIDFQPSGPGRLINTMNVVEILAPLTLYYQSTQLNRFRIDVHVTVKGSLADIGGVDFGFITVNNVRLPACRVVVRTTGGVFTDNACAK